MSGSSFGYLDQEEVPSRSPYWPAMRDQLVELGALDVVAAMDAIAPPVNDATFDDLNPVFHAVEWWCSGDWGREEVEAALAEFRRKRAPTTLSPRQTLLKTFKDWPFTELDADALAEHFDKVFSGLRPEWPYGAVLVNLRYALCAGAPERVDTTEAVEFVAMLLTVWIGASNAQKATP